jgi:hypothetical protein
MSGAFFISTPVLLHGMMLVQRDIVTLPLLFFVSAVDFLVCFLLVSKGNCSIFRQYHPLHAKTRGDSSAVVSSCKEHWQHRLGEQVQ